MITLNRLFKRGRATPHNVIATAALADVCFRTCAANAQGQARHSRQTLRRGQLV